ncbi:hypothetical protein LIER_41711 [Lithospermum erythrorhizon]|uniref:Retrotransposon Copia-like N-terminal domain-containing protein n=1 Tax=Lithospermum erythrorhizon TaxID=34254 RepID=A0AAV3RER9_LITER
MSDLLIEHNYQTWSRVMIIALQARDKVVFINGQYARLGVAEDTYKQWVKVNATLISWILNSMSKDLERGFAYATDAFMLWEEIKTQFGGGVGPRVYEIRRAIYTPKQGKDSVDVFYNILKGLKTGLRFGDFEEEKMMLFLMGLNDEFKSTRNQIFMYDLLPNLAKAYGMIVNVEK